MRAKICDDGVKRINAKIEIPMSHNDVSDYILSAITTANLTIDSVQRLNKRELLRLAKGEIYQMGVEKPKACLDIVDRDTSIIIRNYVKQMFPELT